MTGDPQKKKLLKELKDLKKTDLNISKSELIRKIRGIFKRNLKQEDKKT